MISRRAQMRAFGAALLLLSSCAMAPGMKLDEWTADQRAHAPGATAADEKQYGVVPLSPAILTEAVTEAAKAPPPVADPLAAEAASYEYRVAPLDVLAVTVWDHPELTAPTGQFRSPEENGVPVTADGNMYYPFVGTVKVAGKTVQEIRDILANRLSAYVDDPQLNVRVAAYRGKRVQVTGEVLAPSTLPISDVPMRVQDALAAAKGFTPEADPAHVLLGRGGRTFLLDMQAFYEQGDLSQNWLLTDGDVLNVPDRNRNKVFVIGEVRRPGARVMVKGRMTLAEALNDTPPAGSGDGIDPVAGNPAQIYVIRGRYERPTIYKLDASSPDAMLLAVQFPLRPRDVVFVSTYELARWNRVISQILPTIQAIWQTFDITNRSYLLVK